MGGSGCDGHGLDTAARGRPAAHRLATRRRARVNVDSDCPQRRLDLLPSGVATPSRPLGDFGQVEKLASISQTDPCVSHLDVVLALLLVRFLRERRASCRRPPCALGSSSPSFIGFGLHGPSSQRGRPPNRPRYMLRGRSLSVARLSAGYFCSIYPLAKN